jgi:hypothetical protein
MLRSETDGQGLKRWLYCPIISTANPQHDAVVGNGQEFPRDPN